MQSPAKPGGGVEGPPRKGRAPHRLSDEMMAVLRAALMEIRTEFAKRERFRPLLGNGVRMYEDFPKFR